jgi:hypothetical protein
MNHQLMAEKVEIDPVIAGATFFQAEHLTIETPGSVQIVNRDGQMKRGQLHRMCLDGLSVEAEFSPVLFD